MLCIYFLTSAFSLCWLLCVPARFTTIRAACRRCRYGLPLRALPLHRTYRSYACLRSLPRYVADAMPRCLRGCCLLPCRHWFASSAALFKLPCRHDGNARCWRCSVAALLPAYPDVSAGGTCHLHLYHYHYQLHHRLALQTRIPTAFATTVARASRHSAYITPRHPTTVASAFTAFHDFVRSDAQRAAGLNAAHFRVLLLPYAGVDGHGSARLAFVPRCCTGTTPRHLPTTTLA